MRMTIGTPNANFALAEWIEEIALASLHKAASPAQRHDLGLQTMDIGGAFVSVGATLPESAIVINRAIGLGLRKPLTVDDVEAVAAAYAGAGVLNYFLHIEKTVQNNALPFWLARLGLEKARGWMKFTRGRELPPQTITSLRIAEAGFEEAQWFGRIASSAFDVGERAVPWLANLIGAPGWTVFMSFEGREPAGVGAVFIADGVAWMDWGATRPAFRQRGSQSALLRRRIMHALEAGCHTMVTATGEEVPGDPQHSYRNIMRLGFREAYLRENWAPPKINDQAAAASTPRQF